MNELCVLKAGCWMSLLYRVITHYCDGTKHSLSWLF